MPQPIRVPNQTWQELDGVQEPFSIRRFQGVSKLNPMFLEPGYAANLYNLSPSSYPALSVRGGMSKLAHINPSVRYVNLSGRAGLIIESGTANLFPKNLASRFTSAWTSDVLNGTYTVSVRGGTGSLTLSGGVSGQVSVGESFTFTISNATVTFSPTGGTPEMCQLEEKPYATSWMPGNNDKWMYLDTDSDLDGRAAGVFSAVSTGSATGTLSMDTSVTALGRPASQKITRTGGSSEDEYGIVVRLLSIDPQSEIRVLLNSSSLSAPGYVSLKATYMTGGNDPLGEILVGSSSGGDWRWVTIPGINNPNVANVDVRITIVGGNGTIWVQAVEAAGRSNVRQPESVLIPADDILGSASGSLEFGVRLLRDPGHTPQYIFDGGGPAGKNLAVYVHTDGRLRCEYGTGNQTAVLAGKTVLSVDTDYIIAVRWSSIGVSLFLNNLLEASSSTPPSLSFGSVGYIGSKADGTSQLDGLLINPGPLILWKADFQQGLRSNTDPFFSPGNLVLAFRSASSSTKTSQADFDPGTKVGVDTATKPGSVLLARQP